MSARHEDAVPRYHFEANTVIRASAGTGKTHALVETVVHLLAGLTHKDGPLAPRNIVAITFTEKAAGEMLERIRQRVSALAHGELDPGGSLATSARMLGLELPDSVHWRQVHREIDQLRVGTFHGFCLSLLQRYPLEAGLEPGFGVYDEDAAWARLNELVELEVLAALQDNPALPGLEALIELVGLRQFMDFGPRGLFDVLPDMVARVRDSGVAIGDVLRLLPNPGLPERQYAETLVGLIERVDTRFQDEKRRLGRVDFSDMQRYAIALLRRDGAVRDTVKRQIGALLVDEFQDTNPAQRDLTLLLAEDREHSVQWADGDAAQRIVLAPRTLFIVGDPKQSIYNFRGADVSVFEDVERHMLGQDGQVFTLDRSFRSRPSLLDAGNAYFARLMDGEMGDVDPWFVHWDERAALQPVRPEPFPWKPVHLFDSEAWCVRTVAERPRTRRGLSQTDEFSALAELILDIVQGSRWPVVDGTSGEPVTRPARFGDISILMHKFAGSLTEMLYQLERRAIPHYVVKGGGFFGAREVSDLAVGLMALSSSADAMSLVAWLRGPMIGLSDAGLTWLRRQHGRPSRTALGRALRSDGCSRHMTGRDRVALQLADHALTEVGRVGETIGPAETIRALLDMTDFRMIVATRPDGQQALANLTQVEELARTYSERAGNSLAGFARQLVKLVESEPKTEAFQILDESQDVVRVLTIHQSKGLDCRIAVIPEAPLTIRADRERLAFSPRQGVGVKLAEAALCERHPAIAKELSSQRLAESRRLMYVAFTRARDHVVLSGPTPVGKERRRRDATYKAKRPDRAAPNWMATVHALKHDSPPWLNVIPVDDYVHRFTTNTDLPPAPDPPLLDSLPQPSGLSQIAMGGRLTCAVTQLRDFHSCARRFWLAWEHGISDDLGGPIVAQTGREHTPIGDIAEEDIRWPVEPTQLGTLAHGFLEHIDLARYRGLNQAGRERSLFELGELLGYRASMPQHVEMLAAVRRVLDGDLGARFAESHAFEREAAFVLHVPLADLDGGLYLRGQVDVMAQTSPDAPVDIIDFKYSRPHRDLSSYRFQLLCYALAVHRSTGRGAGATYRAGIVYLRENHPSVRYLDEPLDGAALEAFGADLSRVGARLVSARQTGHWPLVPTERQESVCRGESCPFRKVCFG